MKKMNKMECTQVCIRSSNWQKSLSTSTEPDHIKFRGALIPGLPDDVAKHCLALIPRVHFQYLGFVCKLWRNFIQSKEFYMVRKQAGRLEEWLYVLIEDSYGKGTRWQVLNSLQGKWKNLPPMPGPVKTAFEFVVMGAKLLVMAGLIEDDAGATPRASADVYEYDSALNRWSKLAKMKVARYEFACAEVDGLVYAVGGRGNHGEYLSSVEVFDPSTNKWRQIESLRCPRWGCFACELEGKLYVMGGRSRFKIGHSRSIDVYNPKRSNWDEVENGCVMVIAHAVLEKKVLCMEWKNERKLAVYNAADNSWKKVVVPLTGSSTVGFCFGKFDGKLFLFPSKVEPYYKTLIYDPKAVPGSEWQTSHIRPLGVCMRSITIVA